MSASRHLPTPDLDPSGDGSGLEDDLGWAIGVVSRGYRQVAMGAVEDLPGGPRGYHVLRAVAQGRPSSQLELARRLGVNKTVMTYLVDELEEAGVVTRRPDPADRRARQVIITPTGARALASARGRIDAAETQLLATLSEEDAQALRDLLRRLAHDAQLRLQRGGQPSAPDCD